jgi:hypothetical protein
MTVVRVPVRVRLELTTDRVDDPDLPEAVATLAGAALGRAIDRARGVPMVRSAGRAGTEPVVTVRLAGDQLPPGAVAALERPLRAAIAAAAARLLARPQAAGAPAPQRGRPGAPDGGEPLDPGRVVAAPNRVAGEAYVLPSYADRGRPVAVELRRNLAPGSPRPQLLRRLHRFTSQQELRDALVLRFTSAVPARLVVIAADERGLPAAWVVEMDDLRLSSARLLGRIQEWAPAVGTEQAKPVYRNIHEADTLRFLYRADSAQERLELRARLIFEKLRQATAGNPQLGERYLRSQALALARQIPTYEGPSQYFELLLNGTQLEIFELDTGDMPTDTLPVAAFSDLVPVHPAEDQERGYGRGCPPLDDAELPEWLGIFGFTSPRVETRETAFLSEPPIESWPPDLSAQLASMVEEIATRLHMPPTRFVGSFLISAMARIDQVCRGLGRLARPSGSAGGDSPRFQELRRLAGAFGPSARLVDLYTRAISAFDSSESLPCPLAGQSSRWMLHFYETYLSARESAVASMFVAECQDVLLDELERSHRELKRRQDNFPAYMRVTRLLLVVLLAETMDLLDLRRELVEQGKEAVVMAGDPLVAWAFATATLVEQLNAPPEDAGPPRRGRVAYRDGAYRVQDEHGRWWTRQELDAVIATGRQQALGVDPLLEKLEDLPDVVHRIRAAQQADVNATNAAGTPVTKALDAEFWTLMDDLVGENEKRTRNVRQDRDIAFGMATLTEADVKGAEDIGAKLGGIHKLANDRLEPLFGGDPAYREGMRALVAAELGKAAMWEFFNLVGLAAIAVFCPAAAFLIGVVEAANALDTAFEHRGIQRAMLGGDEIITKAQAEAELWGAVIGAALAFVPEVGSLARGATGGVKAVIKGEVREAAAVAARAALRRAAVHLAEVAAEGFVKAFVREAVTGYVLNLAIGGAIARFTEAVAREVEVSGSASVLDLPDLIGQAIAGRPAPATPATAAVPAAVEPPPGQGIPSEDTP